MRLLDSLILCKYVARIRYLVCIKKTRGGGDPLQNGRIKVHNILKRTSPISFLGTGLYVYFLNNNNTVALVVDYRYNAAAAERMREKRQKLKIMQVKMDIQRPTRAKEQLKLKTREAWKMNRQKSRANMSKQKRAAILKKRREYYQHKKLSKRDPLHQVNDGG